MPKGIASIRSIEKTSQGNKISSTTSTDYRIELYSGNKESSHDGNKKAEVIMFLKEISISGDDMIEVINKLTDHLGILICDIENIGNASIRLHNEFIKIQEGE